MINAMFYYLLIFISITFWKFLSVVHLFLALLIRLLPKVKKILGRRYSERSQFELKNFEEEGCQSFYITHTTAAVCFHVSSEGEFEQIRWLAEKLMQEHKHVEIIFTSPSVEQRIKKMFEIYRNNLRYLRLPLVTISTKDLSHWITSTHVVLVRYDFFPMILSMVPEKKISLVWFFRTRQKKSLFNNLKWKFLLPLFTFVIASNSDDWWWLKARVRHNVLWPMPLDFRALSISTRLENAQKHLEGCFGSYFTKDFSDYIRNAKTSILHGNCYLNELSYLLDPQWINAILSGEVLLGLVEHKANTLELEKLKRNYQLPFYELKINIAKNDLVDILSQIKQKPGVIIFSGRGFLVELYSLFKVALVGGGFAGDTHSLLEPFLSGCEVYCGPHVNRSSEYYQIKDWNSKKVTSIPTIEQWIKIILPKILNHPNEVKEVKELLTSRKEVLEIQAITFLSRIQNHIKEKSNVG